MLDYPGTTVYRIVCQPMLIECPLYDFLCDFIAAVAAGFASKLFSDLSENLFVSLPADVFQGLASLRQL